MTSKIKLYIAIFVAVVVVGVIGYMGSLLYEGQKEKVEMVVKDNVRLEGEKEDLKTDIIKKNDSDQSTEEVKVIIKEAEKAPEKARTQAQDIVEKKLADIEKKYADLEKTAANEERKRTEISLERAKGLWLSFCLQSPEETPCK